MAMGRGSSGVWATLGEGCLWGAGLSTGSLFANAMFGPFKFKVQHTTKAAAPAAASASSPCDTTKAKAAAPAAASSPCETTNLKAAAPAGASSPCDSHAQALQDCVNHNGSDISRCQVYVDLLNDCRRKGQVAVVEASG